MNNTAFTEAAMEVSAHPRPVASAGYNFVRWTGGAPAPFAATRLAGELSDAVPYLVGAASCLVATALLAARRHHLGALARVDADVRPEPAPA